MPKVSIIIDSTAYLPAGILGGYGITVLPLSILWDGTSYRDGVDIQPAEFYRRLAGSRTLPTTSQVTAPAMQAAFEEQLGQGKEVLGVFLSSKFSGTYEAGLQARSMLPSAQDKIALVDSQLTTMAMGLVILAAARAAQGGESLESCRRVTEAARDRTGVLFVVETLEFLRRGGRIGGAQALLGTVLNIKPLLAMRDAEIVALERIRTKRAALQRMVDIVTERIGDRSPVRLAASHADSEPEARAMLESACLRLNPVETFCQPLSPVIGAHVGPGTVALAYTTDVN